jgi:RNA polymerase sigma-70 factor (ECF subfamily)
LHEVFGLRYAEIADIVGRTPEAARQAATSARRHLRSARSRTTDLAEHTRLVDAFQEACEQGDFDRLVAVLDPNVVSVSDGNGRIGIARRPVSGANDVAHFLLGILRRPLPGTSIERVVVNDAPGFALVQPMTAGVRAVTGVISFGVEAGKIRTIWFAMNPDKLGAWAE